jgi:hypothetical protein
MKPRDASTAPAPTIWARAVFSPKPGHNMRTEFPPIKLASQVIFADIYKYWFCQAWILPERAADEDEITAPAVVTERRLLYSERESDRYNGSV